MQPTKYKIIADTLHHPLSQYRSVNHDVPPFMVLMECLSARFGPLDVRDVALSRSDFSGLMNHTARWWNLREHFGLNPEWNALRVDQVVEALSVEGFTAPKLNRKLSRGEVLLRVRVA